MARRGISIHPTADIEPGSSIGTGTRIWQFCVVKKGAIIGENCNIGSHCYIEWGATVGNNVTVKNGVALWEGVHIADGVFIGPFAIFTNDRYPRSPRLPEVSKRYSNTQAVLSETFIEYGATIGAGSMILAGVKIGRFATVGMGSVVVRDIADYRLAAGNPARNLGWMCECGKPLRKTTSCAECSRKYRKVNQQLRRIS